MQLRLPAALAALALGLALAPAAVADEEPGASDAATAIEITGITIDPKVPSRVRVELDYTCAASDGPRSLNTSVEQTDPDDPATVAFGSTRTSPTLVVCDGSEHSQSVVVQSKTSNWLEGVDAVVITTLADLGAAPPAFADAQQLVLDLPADA
ncbi:hypothetical protein [Kitasatospora sp. CB01950]|uniref:hypothetical protein n=1 Tax=Kitasatospora sp. CB01950 TaxID=1703930 RepID=UPI0009391B21|nr:hypothetical protein [Kitasatospora sp. CB01950]OKJ05671.1 hypothetical protein AMK19_25635 [Kitasatospora sp. CB01950]